jgi:hypothetical protein
MGIVLAAGSKVQQIDEVALETVQADKQVGIVSSGEVRPGRRDRDERAPSSPVCKAVARHRSTIPQGEAIRWNGLSLPR